MKTLNLTIMTVLLFSKSLIASGQGKINMLEELSLTGPQFKAVEIATAEFKKKQLDILKYKISLYSWGATYVVLFEDPNISEYQLGSSPNMPSFEVEISADYQVLRSNFSR